VARSTAKFSISAEDKTRNAFRSVTGGIDNLERKFFRLAAPITGLASAAGFGALITKTVEQGDVFDKMAQRTGLAVEELSGLSYAADITGTNLDSMERSLKYLTQQMLDVSQGTGESLQTFEALGVSVTDTHGRLRGTTDVLREVADKLSVMDDETRMAAYAMELFGSRAGQGLIPMLKLGGRGIDELIEKNRRLGGEWTTLEAIEAAKFKDSLRDLTGAAGGLGRALAMELIPHLTEAAEKMAEWVAENREFIRLEVKDKIEGIKESLDTLSEHKDVIGYAIGGAFLATHISKLTRLAVVLWSIAAAKELITSLGNEAPISERFLSALERRDFEFGGGGARGGRGAGGGFGEDLKLTLPVETIPRTSGIPVSSLALPEIPEEMFDLEKDVWDKTYSGLIKADEKYQDQRHAIWLRGMENRIRLDHDGIDQQRELLNLWFEDEFGMLAEQDERKILARNNLNMELELLERDHLERMVQEQHNSINRIGSYWGDFLYDMQSRSGNVFDNIADEFDRMITRMMIKAAVVAALNIVTGGQGGFWANFGLSLKEQLGFRAGGGDVQAGRPYVVGERGPELFVPGRSGSVIPAAKPAGPTTIDQRRTTITAAWVSNEKPSSYSVYEFARMLEHADDLGLLNRFKRGGHGDS
jgi:hypothetical protein